MNDPILENKSNERLEQEIAAFYWDAHREAPGIRLNETGVLGELWAEFDRRVDEGLMEIE